MGKQVPDYIHLQQNGGLKKKAGHLFAMLSSCKLCPWKCGVDRTKGEKGVCRASITVKVASAIPHFGEEPVISGSRGSGTIFFSHCNLKCCYCQNYQISQNGYGEEVSVKELSDIMLNLQAKGCHNINLVSGSHYLPQIIQALNLAAADGLVIPIVYNTNGYEDAGVLQILDGIVDVYLPDVKYGNDNHAMKYSAAKNYSLINGLAMGEMFRQVGHLIMDSNGIALRGIVVRHLVLPAGVSGIEPVLNNLMKNFGRLVFISLMAQYRPCYKACKFKNLSERTSRQEYLRSVKILESFGFQNGWLQDWDCLDMNFFPDFKKTDTWR